jgi:hypothetical protein
MAEAPVPEASAAKPQKTVRHQSRRRYPYDTLSLWSFDHHYSRGGRQRFRTLFW